jgi:hypothetical protein
MGLSVGRMKIQSELAPLVKFTSQDARVYHIWQNSNGMLHRISTYELTPRHSNRSCWTVGEPYTTGDVWTCRMSAQELGLALLGYDYVFVGHADAVFWQRFGELFEGSNEGADGSIWRVNHIGSGIQLRRWPVGHTKR